MVKMNLRHRHFLHLAGGATALPAVPQPGALNAGKEAPRPTLLIISRVRFLREALAEVLHRDLSLALLGVCADLDEAVAASQSHQPDIVLFDAGFPDGTTVVRQLRQAIPELCIVVLAAIETVEDIIAWTEAGATGYVPQTAALADLVGLLINISRGDQVCSPRIASGLLRHLARIARSQQERSLPDPVTMLTKREREIGLLICAGLSNKEIARRLDIGVATTKSHVHSILAKMNVQRRAQAALRLGSSHGSMGGIMLTTPGSLHPCTKRGVLGGAERASSEGGS